MFAEDLCFYRDTEFFDVKLRRLKNMTYYCVIINGSQVLEKSKSGNKFLHHDKRV